MYDEKFYSEPCVTVTFLKPWHIHNPRHIQNTAKYLSPNILFKTLCNPDIFRTLVYSEFWFILKSKHIQNPAEYLKWSILLRTLQQVQKPYIFKTFAYSEVVCVSYSLMQPRPPTFNLHPVSTVLLKVCFKNSQNLLQH